MYGIFFALQFFFCTIVREFKDSMFYAWDDDSLELPFYSDDVEMNRERGEQIDRKENKNCRVNSTQTNL